MRTAAIAALLAGLAVSDAAAAADREHGPSIQSDIGQSFDADSYFSAAMRAGGDPRGAIRHGRRTAAARSARHLIAAAR